MDFMEMREASGIAGDVATNAIEEGFYWHEAYRKEAWYDKNYLYEDYAPAYRAGYVHRMRHADASWEQAEVELGSRWDGIKGVSRMPWDVAKAIAHAAWKHVGESMPDRLEHQSEH